MAYTTIKKPSDYFNTKLYTGNGYPASNSNNITGVGFQPDLVWLKVRSNTDNHCWFDSVRGVQKRIASNLTAAESNRATALTSFDSDGFTLGDNSESNTENYTYASWNWLADNTSGSSNTDGSISSTVSASATSGFSIVSWTGTGSATTVGTGLSSTPKLIIVKNRTDAVNWMVYHNSVVTASATNKSFMTLNTADALGTNGSATTFTSVSDTTFGVGTDNIVNGSGDNMIAYCFAEKQGYSKFGSYTGNGSTDGTFVYTGFKPAFVITKLTSAYGEGWILQDNKRSTYNPSDVFLSPSSNGADSITTNAHLDYLSNGFKLRHLDNRGNGSGFSYIYMAFAEQPLVGDNPATAR